jgi:hypothetical protein
MFEKVREAKAFLRFIQTRVPQYGPLITEDARQFRNEIVKATVGAGICGAAGLIFSCFLSVAVITTAWSAPHRVEVAWLVCAAWASIAIVGALFAIRALSGPMPFRLVSHALAADYANLMVAIEHEATSRS